MNITLNTFYDVPTVNNSIYPREMLEPQLKEKLANKTLYVLSLDNFYKNKLWLVNLRHIAATVKGIKEENEKLILDIDILNTPAGDELKNKINEVEFSIAGIGEIDENNVIKDYVFSCIIYSKINS